MSEHKFAYKWHLADGYPAPGIEKHGLKVFGTFICGGGSTMGYKLAGFDHLGGVEIDPEVAAVYKANHNPKYLYVQDIRDFADRNDLPDELFSLDLLDGSPPCSSFSMAGNREKDWGKAKVFREGQAMQRLDDLFFDYIRLAKKLQPKVVIAENVKGMLQGNAKAYVKRIKTEFEAAGYKVQLFLLNAASMGVPQKRERVFFICQRNDLKLPLLKMEFNEMAIVYGEIEDINSTNRIKLSKSYTEKWYLTNKGENPKAPSGNTFGFMYKTSAKTVVSTITSGGTNAHYLAPFELTKNEYCKIGTFPLDYNFKNIEPKYLIGMSVPPVMTAQIAHQVYLQWFK